MITYKEAREIIGSLAYSFGVEKVLLDDAPERVLAEDVYADRDYPPFNRAAMDGFAVRKEDFVDKPKAFKIVDTIFAGATTNQSIEKGECFKIMTGAAVPLSADAVIRREDAEEKGGCVSFLINDIKAFQNIAQRGEDLQQNNLVINKSVRCNPSIVGLLASIGKYQVLVEKLPTVAIITTGNEVVSVDSPVNEVQFRNSNVHLLKALLKKWGIQPSFVQHVPDDINLLTSSCSSALQHDIVILCGGVSAGDADYVPYVLGGLGVQQLFHKTAIRPGKPFWCGQKDKTMVFALPGNPFSCLVTFTIYIQHYLQSCFGLRAATMFLPIGVERKQKVKLDEFFPVKVVGSPAKFHPLLFNGSGDIRLGFEAQAYAIHPSACAVLAEGDMVEAYLV